MERYRVIKPHTYSAFGSSIKISRPGSKTSSTGRKSSVGSSKPPKSIKTSVSPKIEQKGKGIYYVTNAIQLQLENKPKNKKGPVISRNHK